VISYGRLEIHGLHFPQGRNVIADWFARLLAQEQSDFQALMRILAKTRQWHRGTFKLLGKQYPGRGELRFNTALQRKSFLERGEGSVHERKI
jgi:hypothetical protein